MHPFALNQGATSRREIPNHAHSYTEDAALGAILVFGILLKDTRTVHCAGGWGKNQ